MGDGNKRKNSPAWSDDELPIVQSSMPKEVVESSAWSDDELPVLKKKSSEESAIGSQGNSINGQTASLKTGSPEPTFRPDPSIGYVGSMKAQPTTNQNAAPTNLVPASTTKVSSTHPFTDMPVAIPNEDWQKRTANSIGTIAADFSENIDKLGPRYAGSLNIPYTDKRNPINRITDPHGDPTETAAYISLRMSQEAEAKKRAVKPDPLNPGAERNVAEQYNQKIKQLLDSGSDLLDLQLFNRDYSNKKYTDVSGKYAEVTALAQYNDKVSKIDKEIEATKKGPHPNGVYEEKRRNELNVRRQEARMDYERQLQQIKADTKFDPVMLGAEKAMLLGQKAAREDYENLRNGRSIPPDRRYNYHALGNKIIQFGHNSTTSEGVKKASESKLDLEGKGIKSANMDYLADQARAKIGNARYRQEVPILSMIVPSGKITRNQIIKLGEEEGIDPDVLAETAKDPDLVPQSATLQQQAAKGALNFLAPTLYEQSVRRIASMYGIDKSKVDDFFSPGWEQQRGLGAAIAGNMPSEQNSIHNVRGALGAMTETAAMLPVFGGVAKGIGKGAEALGASEAAAEKAANFGIMALEGYNNAYHEAKDIVGDKPEDEGLRQLYSVVSGTLQGAIYSASPPTKMVRGALGEMKKGGEELLNEMKRVGVRGAMRQEFVPAYAKFIREIAKAEGTIIAQSDANLMAQNMLKNMFTKEGDKKVDVTEGLGDETLRTAISFLLPSIASGIGTARMQTPLNKAAMFDVGSKPQIWQHYVEEGRASGKFTNMEANQMLKGINDMSTAIRQTPVQNEEGVPLTPDQIRDYSFSLMQEGVLRERLDKLRSEANLFKRPVDKAQESPINEQISALQKQRTEILKSAGELRVVPPEEEKAPEELKENLVESEEKIIPLSSETETSSQQQTTKSESNGSIQDNEGRQERPDERKTEDVGTETEVRQPANSEGRQQQEEGRLLEVVATEKESEKQGEETPPALVVSENPEEKTSAAEEKKSEGPRRKRRKFVEEEAPTPQSEEKIITPSEEIKTETNASTQSKEQQQEGNQQGGTPEPPQDKGETALRASVENQGKESRIQNTKVKDAEGIPLTVYHGTKVKSDRLSTSAPMRGLFFAKDKDIAETYGHDVREANLNIENPIVIDAKGADWSSIEVPLDKMYDPRSERQPTAKMSTDHILETLLGRRFPKLLHNLTGSKSKADGVIIRNVRDKIGGGGKPTDIFIPFNDDQIFEKSKSEGSSPGAESVDRNTGGEGLAEEKVADVTHTPGGTYVSLGEDVVPGSLIKYRKGGRVRLGRVSEAPVKKNNNKSLVGMHRVTEQTNANKFDFQSYNARKKAVASMGDPTSLEEAVLRHLLSGGKFKKGTKEHPGIERHLSTKEGTKERKRAEAAWLSEEGAKADQFGYDFDQSNVQNEGEIGEIISRYSTKSEVLDRLYEIYQEQKSSEEVAQPETVSFEIVDPETGRKEYVEFDLSDPEIDSHVAQFVGVPEGDIPAAFTEEGHPVYESEIETDRRISDMEMSDEEADALAAIFAESANENGDINEFKFIDAAQKAISDGKIGKALRDLLHEIVPFPESNENEIAIEKIKKSIADYEQRKKVDAQGRDTETAVESGSEGGAEKPADAEAGEDSGSDEVPADARRKELGQAISSINEDLVKQRASAKMQYSKLVAADKAGDVEAANKANENWQKKKDRIEKLEEKLKDAERELRDIEIEATKTKHRNTADRIREFGKKVSDGSAGMVGAFPGISPKSVGKFIEFVGDAYEALGNMHVAIMKALQRLRDTGAKEKATLSDVLKIKSALDWMEEPMSSEPTLSKANKEVADDYVADIEDGIVSYEDAVEEILSLDDLSDSFKGKILNYLEWQVQGKDYYVSRVLREPKASKSYLADYPLTKGDKVSKYLSGETLQDVFGKDVQFDIDSKETLLQENLLSDAGNMVGLAKKHAKSDDVLVFGPEMLRRIQKLPDGGDGKSVKKILAASGLNNELNGEFARLQNELKTASPERATEIRNRMRQVDKLIRQAEVIYRDIASGASDVLNAARINRVIRDTYFADEFASRILTDAQNKAKSETETALTRTDISDKVAEEGALRDEKSAIEEIEDAEADIAEAPESVSTDLQKKKEAGEKKTKGFLKRIREKVLGKEPGADNRKEVVAKNEAKSKAEEYLKGSTFEELLNKAKEQTKKPC